ncbi:MAG: hypothetical protein QOF30_1253, partial [Acidimicrobiaceae bacterium]|nr:hypothetical protein [Acidimicrobiaceae bacterium]
MYRYITVWGVTPTGRAQLLRNPTSFSPTPGTPGGLVVYLSKYVLWEHIDVYWDRDDLPYRVWMTVALV